MTLALGLAIAPIAAQAQDADTIGSLLGVLASALLDLPTGATVACVFGITILLWSGLVRPLRRHGTLTGPWEEPT